MYEGIRKGRKTIAMDWNEKRQAVYLMLTFGISFTRVPHLYNPPREQYPTPQKKRAW
jgi:hypothetical protein